MSNTIVMGFDGTPGAHHALEAATGLARELGATVHLVFSFSTPRLGGELRDLDEAIAERARTVLGEGEGIVRERGIAVTTSFVGKDPAEGLITTAEELGARMIVVGSYGERPLKSALVGSTPTRLLHLSEIPVLVVRIPETD